MKQLGTPVQKPKEYPGPGWKISKETMREIEKIEDNIRRAAATPFWFD